VFLLKSPALITQKVSRSQDYGGLCGNLRKSSLPASKPSQARQLILILFPLLILHVRSLVEADLMMVLPSP
jgi:hypothetical protein